jgi:uncharacterized caspase-like protein
MAKVALLIGVSEYEVGLNPLPAAVKDVVALERILKDSEMGDFDEVKVLTNPEPQAMQYEVETLFSGRSKDDFVLLFFSGHGIKDDSNNLYFATRITKKSAKGDLIRSTAVPARFVHEVMNNSRAKRQAIILDCCFSGAFDPSLFSKDDGSVDLQGQLGSEGRVVLTSSSSTQYSFEQQGSDLSLYTRYLIEGIETGAGDLDEDGKVSVRELHEYATSKVQETAPNMTPKLITLKDLGFDLVLAKAKVTDPKLRYRRQVEKYSSRGAISSIGRTILDRLQIQLRLSAQVAKEIETEVLSPYQERLDNLQRYQKAFENSVKHEYPLSRHVLSELEDLLEILGLRREDVDSIEQEIVAQNSQSSEAIREEYQQKLQRYEQEFLRAVEAEYPLSTYSRNGLNDFQKSLGLKFEDVEQIERPILAQEHQQGLEAQELKQKQEKLNQKQDESKYSSQSYEQELFHRTASPPASATPKAVNPFIASIRNGGRNFSKQEKLNQKQDESKYSSQSYEQELFHRTASPPASPPASATPKAVNPFIASIRNKGRDFSKPLESKNEDITGTESSILQTQDVDQNNQQVKETPQPQEAVQDSKTDLSSKTLIPDPTNSRDNLAKEKGDSHNKTRRVVFTIVGLLVSSVAAAITIHSVVNQQKKASESKAKIYTGELNKAQQAFYLKNQKFSSAEYEIGGQIISLYDYKIKSYNSGKNPYAISIAVPTESGLKSYIGGTFLVILPNKESTILTILCESKEPPTTPPSPPKLVGQSPQCASGTTQIQ